ncbi:MAG TPA: aldo/keto reductase [Ilumatobacter sp.]|jgi:aryl-alcohol dehydrogenase-like predicted oxidoreductase|nr:aldo/keto reductase [Ilumatobacter sp.]
MRQIGDTAVSAIGLGGLQLSVEGRPDEPRSIATIHAALDAGITLIDTADAYHIATEEVGHNESLIARALDSYGDSAEVLVATKGGHLRSADGGWRVDGSPDHLRQACEASLRRLGVEAIALYQFHRPDPSVPFDESIGAIRDLLDAGKIRMAGVSNANPDQIRTAQQILGGRLASVQNEFSPSFTSSAPELELCDALGIAFLAWRPLRGVGDTATPGTSEASFVEIALEVDASPQQVVLAWMLAKSPIVIPITGSTRPETIRSSAAAIELELTSEQMVRLDTVLAV